MSAPPRTAALPAARRTVPAPLPVPAAADRGRPRRSRLLLAAPLLLLAWGVPRLAQAVTPVPAPAAAYGLLAIGLSAAMMVLAYRRYDDPAETVMRRRTADAAAFPALPERPSVSFLLAVKDERDRVEACVRSMAASTWPDLEIVVVDDGSTDGTGDILRRLARELPVRLVTLERNMGKKHALVRGVAHAGGQVIAFTDSDCVLAPDALARCVAALRRHPELGAVSGHARALNVGRSRLARLQDVWYEGQFRIAKAAESAFGAVTCVSGPLAVFRREAIEDHLPAWAGDRFLGAEFRFATDRQLTGWVIGQRWRRTAARPRPAAAAHAARPWRTAYCRSAWVWTAVPETPRAFLRQQVRWKKSFLRNLVFTGGFMWRLGAVPALLYYGHAVLVLASPFMVAAHLLWWPVQGLWVLTALYLAGVLVKGLAWGLAYRLDHPGCPHWRLRPLMSLLSATALAWLLPYALLTIRRGVWTRGVAR
ncbi:glycosyltransferase [Streptomyces sp. RFCAC02]|uniref:glycosyltransferase family 2 protein n=1 Tax=Streptomyces sp. RFCAC02 TaxID=2499143 RepID=UPI001F0D76E1|nr:glycosyltransferase [Streptomyces sp. RFCAC02]